MKIKNNYNMRTIAGVTVLVPSSVVGKAEVNALLGALRQCGFLDE